MMDKRSKIILAIFCAVMVAIIVTEFVRPKPINWNNSYTSTDKIPFGCYVFYNELESIFNNTDIETVQKSVYDMMVDRDTTKISNYLLVNDYIYFDDQESQQLLDYVGQGNTVFIAANQMGGMLADTLNVFSTYTDYSVVVDTVNIDLTHPKFSDASYVFSRGVDKWRFTSVDTANTTILGHLEYLWKDPLSEKPNEQKRYPNFIKIIFGKGAFYFNLVPEAYSNYYMLGGNEAYVTQTLSYLDDRPLYWDDYKKAGRVIIDSPMRFVLNQAPLKWTYYLTVVGLLLFVIFRAKREQRIIPVIEPLQNSSVEFAQTVGSLYHQNKDFTDIINKKLNYFFEYLRSRYHVDTNRNIERLIPELAAKSGKSLEDTKKLLEFVHYLKNKQQHSEGDSIELSKKITAFKN